MLIQTDSEWLNYSRLCDWIEIPVPLRESASFGLPSNQVETVSQRKFIQASSGKKCSDLNRKMTSQ